MMAAHGTPNERAIAAGKLRNALALQEADRPESHWERAKRAEAEREAREIAAREAEIARIVRAWERGAFAGATVRSGATLDHAFRTADEAELP